MKKQIEPVSCLAPKLAAALWLMALTSAPAQSAVEAWVRRYNHPADSSDVAQKVVTDNAGNVIVAGYTDDAINGTDFLIIKYSGSGLPLWTNRYNGPVNSGDYATAVAVDGSGNVFVTGYSASTNVFDYPNYDYATVAYSGAGVPLWTNRYNGPGNRDDYASAVAVDGGGNVFVTGYSASTNVLLYDYDYATIAYSGAGMPLCTNRYNGPGNNNDEAKALAVDGSGSVFVTGQSWSGTSWDFVTIKYVYSIPLHHQIVGNQLVLSWANAAFSLQSAPAVQGPYTDVSGATSPYSTAFSGAQRFFRLKAN